MSLTEHQTNVSQTAVYTELVIQEASVLLLYSFEQAIFSKGLHGIYNVDQGLASQR